jgi:hypothetical protein
VSWWEYAVYGAAGALAVELIEFYGAVRRTGGWPRSRMGEPGPLPLLGSVAIRIMLGAGLAWVLSGMQQVSGPAGALAVGIAAPLFLEQMAKQFPAQLQLPGRASGTTSESRGFASPPNGRQDHNTGGR